MNKNENIKLLEQNVRERVEVFYKNGIFNYEETRIELDKIKTLLFSALETVSYADVANNDLKYKMQLLYDAADELGRIKHIVIDVETALWNAAEDMEQI